MNRHTEIKNIVAGCVACSAIVELIMLIAYVRYGYAPFGNNSLATMDAKIQYLDFYAWFKDVLEGKNDLTYTFSKMLGGNNIAVYSYYLASPLSLLVVFFEKSQLHIFFDLLVALKLGLAAATMHLYLSVRWEDRQSDILHRVLTILLAICYALSQYPVAQASNIPWLDGVYLLPLIMLGVYRVSKGQSGVFLSIAVATSVICNWYTGGINCITSILWIVWELIIGWTEGEYDSWKVVIRRLIRYIYSMICGVCLSAFLFLPTIYALKKSSRGGLIWERLLENEYTGQFISIIEGFTIGAVSSRDRVALYCGSIVVVGIAAFLLDKAISAKRKLLCGILLAGIVMMFYWQPAYHVFSLLKDVSSYWCRYSYVGIFILVHAAAWYYLQYADRKSYRVLLRAAVCCAIVLLLVNYANGSQRYQEVQDTAVGMLAIAGAISMVLHCNDGAASKPGGRQLLFTGLVSVIVLAELFSNLRILMDSYHDSDVAGYRDYAIAEQQQVDALQAIDDDDYRVMQTATYNMGDLSLRANYNEAMAYGYWSVSAYTSSPDDIQRVFLQRLGYRINGENINVVNTSIIGADSLLGVRYVFSPDPINGYQEMEGEVYNGKKTYRNPYALPLAFTYRDSTLMADADQNPFEYQNQLYSQLMGEQTSVYVPVVYSLEYDEYGQPVYTLTVPQGNYALYGNLPWNSEFYGVVHVGDSYETGYARWTSPSVFYIPTTEDQTEMEIRVTSDNACDLQYGAEQFYALNLDVLAQVSASLNENAAEYDFRNGKVQITAESDGNERLYISVPYDSGWTVMVDGEQIQPELFADCMYSINLLEGQHHIVMTYHVEGLPLGIAVSLVGLLGVAGMAWMQERKKLGTLTEHGWT